MNLRVYTLGSSSSGNAVCVEDGETRILIDAGLSLRAMDCALRSQGGSAAALDAVFVTHEHSDHVRGLPMLTKKHPVTVHIAEPSAPGVDVAGGCAALHPPLFEVKVGGLEVSSFATSHDSRCSVGYIIRAEGHTVGVATDLGVVTAGVLERLAECDSVVLESNHDLDMLERGPYPEYLKRRILSKRGHLSNAACAETAVTLAGAGVRRFLLAHLSEENNRPELALIETASALARRGISGVSLAVAGRCGISRLC